eukprot:GHVU01211052.1.p1 GENE.GHVU01211052.1~~GHVU01211052.1.p1  ORF type:complete len:380 (-),score=47.93 GHVU01211052.1:602-1741(-)
MMEHGILGASCKKGYMHGFDAYREQIDQMLVKQREAVAGTQPCRAAKASTSSESLYAVDPEYDSEYSSVAAQLQGVFLHAANSVSKEMKGLLQHFGCDKVSPFAVDVRSLSHLAATLFKYLPAEYQHGSRHADTLNNGWGTAPEHPVEEEVNDDDESDSAKEETTGTEDALVDIVDSMRRNFTNADGEEGDYETALPPLLGATEPAILDQVNCGAFTAMLRLPKDDCVGAKTFALARECLQALGASEQGRSDNVQKAKSLQGRWFSGAATRSPTVGTGTEAVDAAQGVCKRNDVLRFRGKLRRVLSVYTKSYGKFLICGSAPIRGENCETIVHAVAAKHMFGRYSTDDSIPLRDRYKVLRGKDLRESELVVPRAEESID